MMYRVDKFHRETAEKTAGCGNMLEVLLTSVRELNGKAVWHDTERRLMANLKKFYPHVFDKVQRDHTERGINGLRFALDKCRADGYLDPNADIELFTRLFFMTMGTIMCGDDIVLPEGVTRESACGLLIINFLRGMSSVKGMQVIDEILAREKRPAEGGGYTEEKE